MTWCFIDLSGVTITFSGSGDAFGVTAATRLGNAIAYTGDTAWTGAVADAADGADLLIAEAYHPDKNVPYHLRLGS